MLELDFIKTDFILKLESEGYKRISNLSDKAYYSNEQGRQIKFDFEKETMIVLNNKGIVEKTTFLFDPDIF